MSAAPLAYVNGRLVPQGEASLPLWDAGFVWGATVTDLCRTVKHRLYRWPDHLARFRDGCRAARVYPPLADDDITQLAEDLAARNAGLLQPEQDLVLVLLATPGPVGYYAGRGGGAGDDEPTFVMHTFPLPFARYRRLFREGARLVIPPTRHVPAVCVDPRVKQRSRMHWWLAEQEAHQVDPLASALLLDEAGNVTETAAANFLLVRGGAVLTPPPGAVLAGVSLGVVRELSGELGVRFEERPLTLCDCQNADEAMLASTPYCLAGVSRLNNVPVTWPGPVWRRLLAAWGERIGLDIAAQVEGCSAGQAAAGIKEGPPASVPPTPG